LIGQAEAKVACEIALTAPITAKETSDLAKSALEGAKGDPAFKYISGSADKANTALETANIAADAANTALIA
jgi:hypothetical protein